MLLIKYCRTRLGFHLKWRFWLAIPLLSTALAASLPQGFLVSVADYGNWSVTSQTNVTAPGVYQLTLDTTSFSGAIVGGAQFMPLAAGVPIYTDVGAAQEEATPSAVVCSFGAAICTITITLAHAHAAPFLLRSADGGLQEALNAWRGRGATLVLDPSWQGTTAQLTGAAGAGNLVVLDARQPQWAWYGWSAAGYRMLLGLDSPAGSGIVTAATVNPQALDGIRFCDQYPGADPGAQCNAAMNALPAQGGLVYAAAPQNPFLTNPFAGVTAPVTLELGCGSFSLSTAIALSGSGQALQGAGNCTVLSATQITTIDNFSSATPWSAQNAALTLNTSSPAQGTAALHLVAAASGAVSITRSVAVSLSSQEALKFWIKHDAAGSNVVLALTLGDGTNSSTWDIVVGETTETWALNSLDLNAPSSTSGALNLNAITSLTITGFGNGGSYDLDGLDAYTRNDLVDVTGSSAAPLSGVKVGNLSFGGSFGAALNLSYVNDSQFRDFEVDGGGGAGAIQLSNASYNQLDDFTVRNSAFSGVHLLNASDYNSLTGFTASTSVGAATQLGSGVLFENSDHNTLANCLLYQNGLAAGSGFDLLNSGSYNRIGCSADGNGDDGFRITASAPGATQQGNSFDGVEASGNFGFGVAAIGFDPADLIENLGVSGSFSGNGGPNGDGVYLANVADGRFDVTVSGNQRYGINFDNTGSTGSTGNVARITAVGNGVSGWGSGVNIATGVSATQVWLDAASANRSGAILDAGSATRIHSSTSDATVFTAVATGVCPSANVIYPWGAGAPTTACGDTTGAVPLVIPSLGTLGNLTVHAGTTGSTPGSGVVTVWKNGVATALACTIGNTATACSDDTDQVTVAAGDTITIHVATAAGETLANLSFSFEKW